MKAQKIQEKLHSIRRQHWLMSDDGLRDGLDSVNEIFSLIETRISRNASMFETLGIELGDKHRFLRSISNDEYGCQIELTGFLRYSYNHLINLRLEIILFSKTPIHQTDAFDAKFISGFLLKADLTSDNQVIWKEQETAPKSFRAEGVCEMMFSLLVNQIGKNYGILIL